MRFLAQKLVLPETGTGTPIVVEGPQGLVETFGENFTLAAIINKLLPILFSAAGIILFFYLIAGGFDLLLSTGDPKKAEGAKGKITNAIIGFIIIFVAWWLTKLLSTIFGLEGF